MNEQPTPAPAPRRYRQSAGILVYRRGAHGVEVLLGHPGGPFWVHKDEASWTIFKGEFDSAAETPLDAARREFAEETGFNPAVLGDDPASLGSHRQRSGKLVYAFAVEAELDAEAVVSNVFDLEFPPHSGRFESVAEIDRAAWYPLPQAADKIMPGQRVFLERLAALLGE